MKISILKYFLVLLFFNLSIKIYADTISNIYEHRILSIDKSELAKMSVAELESMGMSKEETLSILQEPLVSFKKDDFSIALGGNMNLEYYFYNNMYLLNKNLPDQEGYFRETIDLTLDLVYGYKKFGHRAFQLFIDLQSKDKWGFSGAYKNTTATQLSIEVKNDTINNESINLGYHDHRNPQVFPWVKDAWMQFSFNSIFNIKSEKLQFFKMGWFPFFLGNGIALGDAYNLVFENLTRFTTAENASNPGIDIFGQIIKGRLLYDLYYAKFKDKSTTLDTTYNNVKKNFLDHPEWRGVAKDDELWAARLQWLAIDSKKYGTLTFEPYIFYKEGSDLYSDQNDDSKVGLGTYGLSVDYLNNRLNFGGEIVCNFGKDKFYALDKNSILLKRDDTTGALTEIYSNVYYWDDTQKEITANATVTKNIKDAADSETNKYKNYGDFYTATGNIDLTNVNRIRPFYKCDLGGLAAIAYCTYNAIPDQLDLSLEFGHASGDYDSTSQETNHKDNNFIGVHELFFGKKVYSIIMLSERVLLKPTALRKGQVVDATDVVNFQAVTQNNSFTDINYFGASFKWTPKILKNKYFEFNPNLMFFWNDKGSYKYIASEKKASETQKASTFLGTELNFMVNCELLKNLSITGILAFFFPGQFFKDMKGLPLYSFFDYDNPLSVIQPAMPNQYYLGDNTATYGNLSLTYRF
ncbi:hypothetical protein K9M16_03665 [Candidatus Babeliales bacterium]|nr:hypothetical protein [Candidatus Babeliales bacterium]